MTSVRDIPCTIQDIGTQKKGIEDKVQYDFERNERSAVENVLEIGGRMSSHQRRTIMGHSVFPGLQGRKIPAWLT